MLRSCCIAMPAVHPPQPAQCCYSAAFLRPMYVHVGVHLYVPVVHCCDYGGGGRLVLRITSPVRGMLGPRLSPDLLHIAYNRVGRGKDHGLVTRLP
jgi:hypothetical protein